MDKSSSYLNGAIFVAVCCVVILLLWPADTQSPGGGTWVGRTLRWLIRETVTTEPPKPVPPIVAPSTRCLIFSAKWCGPCTQLKRNVATMARSGWRIGPLPTDDIEFIDVDGRDERLSKYPHSSIPTLVIVDRSGREVARKTGVMGAEELGEWIRANRK